MIEFLKQSLLWLRELSAPDRARLTAYLIAPGSILLFTISGFYGGIFAVDLSQPLTFSELKTVLFTDGTVETRPGFMLNIEPVVSDFRLHLRSPAPHIWSSLDASHARANRSHFVLDSDGVGARPPFYGVVDPVTFIIEGQIDQFIDFPGRIENINDFKIRSRRSVSAFVSVLAACFFAFGMSLGSGAPPIRRKKHARSQKGA